MKRFLAILALAFATPSSTVVAQARITTPMEQFGHNFGDDYFLANYAQIAAYWRVLDDQSDRMVVQEIGKTAEGRPHLMAVVTSPENHRRLEQYRQVRLILEQADPAGTDAQLSMGR